MIWFSIVGVLPFTLALPYADLFWINVLAILIGLILSSAFPAIVVFAQELVPGRVGLMFRDGHEVDPDPPGGFVMLQRLIDGVEVQHNLTHGRNPVHPA